jgi:dual specificity tyrosine-phosphorylation-regulated kinase 2/3/4
MHWEEVAQREAGANTLPADDRVRKFQKTSDQGSRLRKTSASNAITAARPLPAINNNTAGRGRAKVPLGPRERPQDFNKQR